MKQLLIALFCCTLFACQNNGDDTESGNDVVGTLPPENSDLTQDSLYQPSGEYTDQCYVIRYIPYSGFPELPYLLHICTEGGLDGLSIDLSEPGDPPVTVLFDTIRSFASNEDAILFARKEGLRDVLLDKPELY
jgi:hypothetical protein